MAGLLDIAPPGETVPVGGAEVAVTGVSARGVAVLLQRFPELRALFAGRTPDAARLAALGPDIVAAIIAAGTGSPGVARAEAVADRLPADTQIELLAAILRVTMPRGPGPLVERLGALGEQLGLPGLSPAAAATSSPAPSSS